MAKSLLTTNQDTEALCNTVSAISGIGKDSIKEVWDATVLAMLFTLEPRKFNLQTLTVPMIGKIGFKTGKTYHDQSTGKPAYDIKTFLSVSSDFKNIIGDIINNGQGCLVQYAKDIVLPSLVTE